MGGLGGGFELLDVPECITKARGLGSMDFVVFQSELKEGLLLVIATRIFSTSEITVNLQSGPFSIFPFSFGEIKDFFLGEKHNHEPSDL